MSFVLDILYYTALVGIWALTAFFAAIAMLIIVAKYVDRRRHRHCPEAVYEMRAIDVLDYESLPPRDAPLISDDQQERVARLCQVVKKMRSGDPITYSGRNVVGYLIRIPTWSSKSHAAILDVENEGTDEAEPYIIQATLNRGVTRDSLVEAVEKNPGQWYWSELTGESSRHYRRLDAIEAATDMVRKHTKYGWPGIVLQAITKLPVLREIAYFTGIAKWSIFAKWPFCSGGLTIWMRTGHLDLAKDRAPELVTPQDVNQCPHNKGWVALFS